MCGPVVPMVQTRHSGREIAELGPRRVVFEQFLNENQQIAQSDGFLSYSIEPRTESDFAALASLRNPDHRQTWIEVRNARKVNANVLSGDIQIKQQQVYLPYIEMLRGIRYVAGV